MSDLGNQNHDGPQQNQISHQLSALCLGLGQQNSDLVSGETDEELYEGSWLSFSLGFCYVLLFRS